MRLRGAILPFVAALGLALTGCGTNRPESEPAPAATTATTTAIEPHDAPSEIASTFPATQGADLSAAVQSPDASSAQQDGSRPVIPLQVAAAAPMPEAPITDSPPPPQVEVVGEPPSDDVAWIPGYWMWHNARWVWSSGAWGRRPHPGARWIPGHWDHHTDGWEWVKGYWK